LEDDAANTEEQMGDARDMVDSVEDGLDLFGVNFIHDGVVEEVNDVEEDCKAGLAGRADGNNALDVVLGVVRGRNRGVAGGGGCSGGAGAWTSGFGGGDNGGSNRAGLGARWGARWEWFWG
jgi:hypothetical protein